MTRHPGDLNFSTSNPSATPPHSTPPQGGEYMVADGRARPADNSATLRHLSATPEHKVADDGNASIAAPAVGTVFQWNDRPYTFLGEPLPHTTKNGRETSLYQWCVACDRCGEDFVFRGSARPSRYFRTYCIACGRAALITGRRKGVKAMKTLAKAKRAAMTPEERKASKTRTNDKYKRYRARKKAGLV